MAIGRRESRPQSHGRLYEWRRASGDGEDHDRGVVLQRFRPRLDDGLLDRHRGGRGGGVLRTLERVAEPVDADLPAVLRVTRDDPSRSTRYREAVARARAERGPLIRQRAAREHTGMAADLRLLADEDLMQLVRRGDA